MFIILYVLMSAVVCYNMIKILLFIYLNCTFKENEGIRNACVLSNVCGCRDGS